VIVPLRYECKRLRYRNDDTFQKGKVYLARYNEEKEQYGVFLPAIDDAKQGSEPQEALYLGARTFKECFEQCTD
jgi:hypothetical protein